MYGRSVHSVADQASTMRLDFDKTHNASIWEDSMQTVSLTFEFEFELLSLFESTVNSLTAEAAPPTSR
jgi:hypothetical protein